MAWSLGGGIGHEALTNRRRHLDFLPKPKLEVKIADDSGSLPDNNIGTFAGNDNLMA